MAQSDEPPQPQAEAQPQPEPQPQPQTQTQTQSQSQSQSQSQPQSESQSQSQTPNVDPKEFYGYLFSVDKGPTKVLNLLLRGIANHIKENVGNKDDKHLTPEKLALFYKAVGGNYDSLFVDTTHPSISWIYASIGCQHSLQPTKNEFAPPSIPCLTERGFVRWQSIEILLGPEEHVPFIQTAVREFNIKNPETGERFPIDLPKEAFPLVPDADIEKWHRTCAEKLRERATPDVEEETPAATPAPAPAAATSNAPNPDLPPRPKVQATYVHVRPSPRVPEPSAENSDHPRTSYFEPSTRRPSRPIPYAHVSSHSHPHSESYSRPQQRPPLNRSPTHRTRQFLAPEEPYSPRLSRPRHRSFPNLSSPSSPDAPMHQPPQAEADSRHPYHASDPTRSSHTAHPRRHSHPRHARPPPSASDLSSSESDTSVTSDSEADDPSPKTRTQPIKTRTGADHRRPHGTYVSRSAEAVDAGSYPPRKFFASTAPNSSVPSPVGEGRERDRGPDRQRDIEEKFRRGAYPIPIDLNGKLSAPFMMNRRKREAGSGPEPVPERREARDSRSDNRGGPGVKWRDLGDIAEMWRNGGARGEAMGLGGHGASAGSSPVREGLRSRGHSRDDRSDRERERDRDRERERERDERESRERDRDYKRRPERPRLQTRHSSHEEIPTRRMRAERDYDARSFRERDRERERDRGRRPVSPVRGVDGRKYPPQDVYR